MATERIVIEITASGVRSTGKKIETIGDKADTATAATDRLTQALKFVGGALIVRKLVSLGDTMITLANKVNVVSNSAGEARIATAELFRIAREGRAPIGDVAQLYQRFALATENLGISQRRTLGITETLIKAVQIVGANSQESTGALIQLAQGLGAGTLRGQELNSVLEQAPVVAKAIAEQFGVTAQELKVLGAQGKITSRQILFALEGAAEGIAESFEQTVPTVAQSLDVLGNSAVANLGTALRPAIELLSKTLLFLADDVLPVVAVAVEKLVTVLKILAITAGALGLVKGLGILIATFKVLGGVMTTIKIVAATAAIGFRAIGASIAAALGPIGIAITAIGAITAAISLLAGDGGVILNADGSFQSFEDRLDELTDAGFSFFEAMQIAKREVLKTEEAIQKFVISPAVVAMFDGVIANANRALEEIRTFEKAVEDAEKAMAKAKKSVDRVSTAFDRKAAAAARKAAAEIRRLTKAVRGFEEELNPALKLTNEYEDAVALLNKAIDKNVISEERANEILAAKRTALLGTLEPFNNIVATLNEEFRLLKLDNEERALQIRLIALQGEALGRLTDQQLLELEILIKSETAQVKAIEARREGAKALAEVERETQKQISSLPELTKRLEAASAAHQKQANIANNASAPAIQKIANEMLGLQAVLISLEANAINKTVDAFGNFAAAATKGNFEVAASFKKLAQSVLADTARIIARQLLLRALFGGGVGTTGQVGGLVGLLGLQHGGQFRVGGQGGPDSQLVAFNASPNERVTVETPSQQIKSDRGGNAPAPMQEVRIINTVSTDALATALESPEGARTIANVISANPDEFRGILSS